MSKHQHPGNPRQMRDAHGHFVKADSSDSPVYARKPIPFTPCLKHYGLGHDIECCGGVLMDIDVYTEGWDPTEVFRACPCNPNGCKRCNGSGRRRPPASDPDLHIECATCGGTGWKKSIGYQPPDDRYEVKSAGAAEAQHPTALSKMEAETSGSSGNGFTLAADYEAQSPASSWMDANAEMDAIIDARADAILRGARTAGKVFICIAVAAAVAGVIWIHGWAS